MEHKRTKKAFTLIELLVVISIIALLVSILLPALSEARNTARRTLCMVNCKSVGTAFGAYASDFKGLTPPHFNNGACTRNLGQLGVAELISGSVFAYYFGDVYDSNVDFCIGQQTTNPPRPKPFGVRCLYDTGMIDNFKVFYCPGQIKTDDNAFKPDRYTHPTTGEWVLPHTANPNDDGSNRIYISYFYFRPMIGGKTPRKLDSFNSYVLYFDLIDTWDDLSHRSSGGDPKGINMLYGDSHVEWYADPAFFDLDLLISAVGLDPWHRTAPSNNNEGPGGNYIMERFIPLYQIMNGLNPLAYQGIPYYTAYDNWAHFYK